MNRPVQLANGRLYLRGLIEEGERKSLEPMVARLGGEADSSRLADGSRSGRDAATTDSWRRQ